MDYSLFISHTEVDAELAAAVFKQLRAAFGTQLTMQFARDHIESGGQWKSWIRDNLESSKAVVSLFTPESVRKPWLYVEWSPFWVHGKDFYILLSGGVQRKDLIEAMWDSQMVDVGDSASIKKFFRTLGRKVGFPLDEAALGSAAVAFAEAVERGRQADRTQSIERFADISVPLPDDDREKRDILEHFYRRGARDVLRQRFRSLESDLFKASIALWVVKQNDLELASVLCEEIRGGDHVRGVAVAMVQAGVDGGPHMERVLACLKGAELRNFALDLVDAGLADTDLLRNVVGRIANASELRTVGLPLIRRAEFNSRVFEMIVQQIHARGNFTPLGDLAEELLAQGHADAPQFLAIMDVLSEKRRQRLDAVLQQVDEREPELASKLRRRYHKPDDSDASH
jgi:hypothetical protein